MYRYGYEPVCLLKPSSDHGTSGGAHQTPHCNRNAAGEYLSPAKRGSPARGSKYRTIRYFTSDISGSDEERGISEINLHDSVIWHELPVAAMPGR